MKNKAIKINYEMFGMITAFHVKHGTAFTAASRGDKLFTGIMDIEGEME